jgi:hypothetical protein
MTLLIGNVEKTVYCYSAPASLGQPTPGHTEYGFPYHTRQCRLCWWLGLVRSSIKAVQWRKVYKE